MFPLWDHFHLSMWSLSVEDPFNTPCGLIDPAEELAQTWHNGGANYLSRRVNLNLQGATLANWQFLIAGDVNNDDGIDDADLLQILFAFGSSDSDADVNGDGFVDDADLLIVLFNFGTSGEGRP